MYYRTVLLQCITVLYSCITLLLRSDSDSDSSGPDYNLEAESSDDGTLCV